MKERTPGRLRIEVVFALPSRQELVSLEIVDGATVGAAIELSQIAERFPDQDLSRCAAGVWGHVVDREHRLKDGDRVELYRPLLMEPQEARRELAAKGKSMRRKVGGER
ncbi:MAG TPA: RnfH family protein [Woeseiaceae bacterium]|nr:RnfH family protein [Woeseiaceae bacterium]